MCKLKKLRASIVGYLNLSLFLTTAWGLSLTNSWAQPSNDNFADAEVISGSSGAVFGSNLGSTIELGEPTTIDGQPGASSIWYEWTAPADGAVTFDTVGSVAFLGGDLDALLGVYIGTDLDSLTSVAENDFFLANNFAPARVTFNATAGTVYKILFSGWSGIQGATLLNWRSSFDGSGASAGHFQFTKSNYIVSENELFTTRHVSMHFTVDTHDLGARFVVTRADGATGKATVEFQVDSAQYTNQFVTNYFGTNIFLTNTTVTNVTIITEVTDGSSNILDSVTNFTSITNLTFTNIFSTNIVSTNFYQNLVDGSFVLFQIPNVRHSTVTNENGNLVSFSTNYGPIVLTNLCLNTNLSEIIIAATVTTNTVTTMDTNVPPLLITNIYSLTNVMVSDVSTTNIFCGPEISVITNIPAAGTNFVPIIGTLDFDDYQMSQSFLIRNFGTAPNQPALVNRALVVSMTEAALDPFETDPIAPPTFAIDGATIEIKRSDAGAVPFDIDEYLPSSNPPGARQDAIFNIERATFCVGERISAAPTRTIRIAVLRSGTNGAIGCGVSFRVDHLPVNIQNGFNFFNSGSSDLLRAGSDFATPVSPFRPSAQTPDFEGGNGPQVTGVLTWGARDFQPKFIDVVINNDSLVEFNEDFLIQLFDPTPGNPEAKPLAVVGQVGRAIVTILSDDPAAGEVDTDFNADASLGTDPVPSNPNPGANATVFASAIQSDGKAIIGGNFSAFNTLTSNPRIARLNLNGLLDASFNTGSGPNGGVTALAISPDGKVLIGGDFTSVDGLDRRSIARLNANGSLDTTFLPKQGANGTVWSIALQPDGKALIAGFFTSINGVSRKHVARLNVDGSLDTTFDPGVGPIGNIFAVALQPDGKVLIGGEFTSVSGVSRISIARLNDDGTLDAAFDPGAGTLDLEAQEPGIVYSLALQPNGKIVIGGAFDFFALESRNSIARLNENGTLDSSFHPGSGADHIVYAVKLQNDGKIFIGGAFASYNSTRRVGVARLFPDGSLDTSFMDTGYNQFAGVINPYFTEFTDFSNPTSPIVNTRNSVLTLSQQSDGNVIIGGLFHSVGGGAGRDISHPRQNVARLVGNSTPGPGNIGLVNNSYTGDENGTSTYITLVRTNGNLGPASATISPISLPTGPGAAVLGTDYSFDTNRYGNPIWLTTWSGITWMMSDGISGQNNSTVSVIGNGIISDDDDVRVDMIDNAAVDGNRSLRMELSNPTGTDLLFLGGENIPLGVALGKIAAQLTIVDNDLLHGKLKFSSPTYTVNEQGTNAVLTVIRENGSLGQVTVNYVVTNGTAILGEDFNTNRNNTLTFNQGVTNQNILIPIGDDGDAEFDETFSVSLSIPTGGAVLATNDVNAVVTIIDNDFAPGRLSFTASSFTTNENKVFAAISVARNNGNVGTVSVQVSATDLTATSGLDFTAVTNTLTWNNGETSIKTLIVPLLNDELVEGDEFVTLQLFNPTANGLNNNTVLGNITNAVLIIADDDLNGDIQFAAPNFFVNENGGIATITVLRVGGSSGPISINYATRDGTAFSGPHYATSSGVLNFAAGEVSKTFSVIITDDFNTNTSRILNLDLSSPSPIGVVYQPTATLTIVDNESINEITGSVDTTLNPAAGVNDFVYALALQSDGKLLFGGDFTAMNQFPRNRIGRLHPNGNLDTAFSSISPTAGANDSVRSIVSQTDGRILIGGLFTKINDVNYNRIARLNFNGSIDSTFNPGSGANNPVYAVAETFVGPRDVIDNRRILVAGSFTTISGQPRGGIARLLNNGEVDGTFNPGLGVNGTNSAIHCMAVQLDGKVIIGGDFISFNGTNVPHIARLNLDGSLDTTFNPQIGPNQSVRAIAAQTDGKIVIGGLFTSVNGATFNHIARLNANGTVDNTFTPGVGANDSVYAVAVQVDGKIVLGGEFTQANGVTRNRLTRLNADGTIDPTINFGEGANSFVTALALQPDGKIVLGGGFTEFDGVQRPHIARLYGGSMNGEGRLEFISADFEANENGTNVVITVRRKAGTIGAVTANVATKDGTAVHGFDYIGVTNTLTFPIGETLARFTIPIINDDFVESDETVLLTLTDSTTQDLGNQQNATLTIKNDDSAISLSSPTYNIAENSISGNAIITVVRTGSSIGEASVEFVVTTNGTATVDADFIPVTNTVFFANGETSRTVAIPLINDSIIEGDETVTMTLSNVIGAILSEPIAATLTIVDDDFGPGNLMFAQTNFSVLESEVHAIITVVRTNGSLGFVAVNYSAGGIGSASPGIDYTPTNGTLTFGPGELSKTFSVRVFEDTVSEGNETIRLTLSNPSGGAAIVGTNSLWLTIVDDDVSFSFSTPAYVVGEGDSGVTMTVRRDNGSNGVVTVFYKTSDGSATNGVDYIGKTNSPFATNTLVFADGELFKTFTIPVLEDSLVEGDETFSVSLFGPSGGAQLANPSNAIVTIVDNDSSLSFSAAEYTVDEGGTNVLITISRTNTSAGIVAVNFATGNGTAVSGSDYSSTNGTLTFLDGESFKTISIPITDDTFVEGDETFFVTINGASGTAVLGAPTVATVTITDNDAGLRFSHSTYGVSESGVNATITVLRTTVTNTTVSVNYSAVNGTATAGADFTSQLGTLTFTNGEVSKTFTVPIIDDTTIEGDETVLLTLFSPVGQATIVNPVAAVITIMDNDGSLIVPAGSALISESFSANGIIEPSETVSLFFAFRNTVGVNTTSLQARLLAGTGVTAPSGPQNYGALIVNGASVSRPFTFTASGTNGQQITATFELTDGALSLGTGAFTYTLGQTSLGFTNSAPILINDSSAPPTLASPYASIINVSGVQGTVSRITVTLSNLNHTVPDDIDVLLVNPTGQKVILMSDAGGGILATNQVITFADSAAGFVPDGGPVSSGTFRPSNYSSSPTDMFPVPAPNGPYSSTLSAFDGINPNGAWSLFIVDDGTLNKGSIAQGWSLVISTANSFTPTADLSLTLTDSPDPAATGNHLTYSVAITNHGPSAASGVVISNVLPAGVTYVSDTGNGVLMGNTLVSTLPTLAKDQVLRFNVVVNPTEIGEITYIASVRANENDPNLLNNAAFEVTTVDAPRANLSVTLSDSPDPVQINSNLTYTIVVKNLGPAAAHNVFVTNTLPPNVVIVSTNFLHGTVTYDNGKLIFNLPDGLISPTSLRHLSTTETFTIVVRPTVAGIITNTVSVGSAVEDPFKANNTASVKSVVELPIFTLAQSGSGLLIEWGTNAPGYVLESTTDLTEPAVWTPVTNSPVVIQNGKNKTVIDLSTGSKFFRLGIATP